MDRLKIAILGCGTWAEMIANDVYAALTDLCQVVAAVDIRPERATRVAAALGAKAYSSIQDAVKEHRLDAVDIRLGHAHHAAGALEAARYGLHALVEKPLATSLEDAERMLEAARKAGVVLCVAENYAFLRHVVETRKLIEQGVIGRLLAARSARVFTIATQGGVWMRDPWRLQPGPAGGVLSDQCCHHTHMLRQLVSEVTHVQAMSNGIAGKKPEDTAILNLRFANGVIGQSLYSWNVETLDAQYGPEAVLYGEKGCIEIHMAYTLEGGGILVARPDLPGGSKWEMQGGNYFDSSVEVVEDWLRACRGERTPRMPGEEGLRDLKVVMAALESIRTGREIAIE